MEQLKYQKGHKQTSNLTSVDSTSKIVKISEEELVSHGCKNCIWRLHSQCKYGIKDGEKHSFIDKNTENGASITHSGYCPEYVDFLLNFADVNDSSSALWEKFSLYISRMQSLEDYKEYLNLCEEVKELEHSFEESRDKGFGSDDLKELKKQLYDLDMKKNMLRVWWERLNFAIRRGYMRVVDREHRAKNKTGGAGIFNAKVINFNTTPGTSTTPGINTGNGTSTSSPPVKQIESSDEKKQ